MPIKHVPTFDLKNKVITSEIVKNQIEVELKNTRSGVTRKQLQSRVGAYLDEVAAVM
jgi:hypothetical protein